MLRSAACTTAPPGGSIASNHPGSYFGLWPWKADLWETCWFSNALMGAWTRRLPVANFHPPKCSREGVPAFVEARRAPAKPIGTYR